MGKLSSLIDLVESLVSAGFPEGTAKKIASGELPMDEASRMARADEQGYLTDAYHASRQDIQGELKPGYSDDLIFSTPEVDFANNWLGKGKMQTRVGAEDEIHRIRKEQRDLRAESFDFDRLEALPSGPEHTAAYNEMSEAAKKIAGNDVPADSAYSAVYPLKVREGKSLDPTVDDSALPYIRQHWQGEEISPESMRMIQSGNYLPFENKTVTDGLKSEGFESMRLAENSDGVTDTIASMYPSDVRSRFAAFDPDNEGLNNLLGSMAGAGVIGASALGSEDADAGVINDPALLSSPAGGSGFLATADKWAAPVNDAAEFVFDALEVPVRGWHGIAGVLGELARGGDIESALANGGKYASQSIDDTSSDYGRAVADETGSPLAAALTHALTQMTNPI